MWRKALLFVFIVYSVLSSAQSSQTALTKKQQWIDSVFNSLTREQRVAQLIMYPAYSAKPELNDREVEQLISKYGIGGLCFFRGHSLAQATLTNRFQKLSKVPVLVAIDGEWGLGMRLNNTISFPRQLPLAAMHQEKWIYEMGKNVAEQCKAIGIHVNFAPVVDINNNPYNPIINDRSFGDNREDVTRLASLYMRGMQDHGIVACLKHFPGHGDTETDSHFDLPEINYPRSRLDSVELYPFRKLLAAGVKSVMIAHLRIPAIDSTPNLAVSLSSKMVTDLLQKEMNYSGLIFTDALTMKGVAKYYTNGEIAVKALQAGNDILLCPENVPAILKAVTLAFDSSVLDSNAVYASVKKLLAYKYDYVLGNTKLSYRKLDDKVNDKNAIALRNMMVKNEITLLRNDNALVPLKTDKKRRIVAISFSTSKKTGFQKTLDNYASVVHYNISRNSDSIVCNVVYNMVLEENADIIISSMHSSSRDPGKLYGMSPSAISLINKLEKTKKQVFVLFGTPYILPFFDTLHNVVLGYQDYDINQEKTAQYLFGLIKNNASLPVNVSIYKKNDGLHPDTTSKLMYVAAEEVGIKTKSLEAIDNIINRAIRNKTFPGCQVLIAKDGKVFYKKEFGHTTYDKNKLSVENTTIYDLASLTKVLSTTLAVMRLYEEGKIDLNDKLSEHLKEARKTNKKDITIKELLTHTAGLKSWIPFYEGFTKTDALRTKYFSKTPTEKDDIQIADSMFASDDVADMVWDSIWASPLDKKGKYVYSDLSFYLLQRVVEKITDESLDVYVKRNFYDSLGLFETGYQPLKHGIDRGRIAPTELDKAFRNQLVWGYVHDQGAAMLGGVAGNAGLFGTSNDVAVIMQMLLNGGTYGGKKFFKKETVDLFTSRQLDSVRRGCGFDKPEPNKQYGGNPVSDLCPPSSYGHTGFTGTMTWADPETGLLFVFVSNRVHPDAANNLITKNNVRTRIMEEMYKLFR